MAMVARECVPRAAGWDLKILATDIDSNVLAKAQAGTYPEERTDGISAERLRRWFRRGARSNAGLVKVDAEAASLVTFKKLNLELTPFRGHFIFWEGGVHNVETKKSVSAGVPATDGRTGPVGPQPGRAVAGV